MWHQCYWANCNDMIMGQSSFRYCFKCRNALSKSDHRYLSKCKWWYVHVHILLDTKCQFIKFRMRIYFIYGELNMSNTTLVQLKLGNLYETPFFSSHNCMLLHLPTFKDNFSITLWQHSQQSLLVSRPDLLSERDKGLDMMSAMVSINWLLIV